MTDRVSELCSLPVTVLGSQARAENKVAAMAEGEHPAKEFLEECPSYSYE